jgi:hypothetical protein
MSGEALDRPAVAKPGLEASCPLEPVGLRGGVLDALAVDDDVAAGDVLCAPPGNWVGAAPDAGGGTNANAAPRNRRAGLTPSRRARALAGAEQLGVRPILSLTLPDTTVIL